MFDSKKSKKQKGFAVEVKNISKTFIIPHEKINTLRGKFVSLFKRKTFEKFKALDNVSFRVRRGEFFGIIGRNGSGKSTLLKILAKIYGSDRGRVKVNGELSPFLELGIGFNPELSGRDNIYLNASILGLSKKEIEEKFWKIVKFSELERFLDQKIKNYSSGMQVRLAFSVAIHANKDILLMDEVLAVGDSNFQEKCLEIFLEHKRKGKTVIFVSHDTEMVRRYCDRALLLRNGRVELTGSPNKVVDRYIYQNMSDEEKRLLREEKRKRKEEEEFQKKEAIKKQEEEREKIRGEKDEEKKKTMQEKENERKRKEEEKRVQEEEKKKKMEEEKRKIAKITKVEFLDKDGKERKVFQTGEDLRVRVWFKKLKPVKVLNFSSDIFSQDGVWVSGVNTINDLVKINIVSNGVLEIIYSRILLNSGLYSLKVGIWGENSQNYGFIDVNFKIFSTNNDYGIFNIPHQWKVKINGR